MREIERQMREKRDRVKIVTRNRKANERKERYRREKRDRVKTVTK